MGESASWETLAAQLDLHPMARGLLLNSLALLVTRWLTQVGFLVNLVLPGAGTVERRGAEQGLRRVQPWNSSLAA